MKIFDHIYFLLKHMNLSQPNTNSFLKTWTYHQNKNNNLWPWSHVLPNKKPNKKTCLYIYSKAFSKHISKCKQNWAQKGKKRRKQVPLLSLEARTAEKCLAECTLEAQKSMSMMVSAYWVHTLALTGDKRQVPETESRTDAAMHWEMTIRLRCDVEKLTHIICEEAFLAHKSYFTDGWHVVN